MCFLLAYFKISFLIDLVSLSDTCNGAYFYDWSGPNGFYHSELDSTVDVFINPVTSVNSGIYSVTITDSRDCIDSLDIDLTVLSVLPVTWINVEVQRNDNGHNISWEVADQTNVEYYTVERMLEGEQFFTPVSDTKTNVFDGYSANYQAIDIDVVSNITHFYRVK